MRTLKPFVWVLGLLLLVAASFAVRSPSAGSAQTIPSAGYFPSSKLHVDGQPAAAPTSAFEDSDDETKAPQPALQTPERAAWLIADAPRALCAPPPGVRALDRRTTTLVGIVLLLV